MSDWEIRNLLREWISSGVKEDYLLYYNTCLRDGVIPQCYWCDQLAEVQCWSCKQYVSTNCATHCTCGSYACPDHQLSCYSNTDSCFSLCGNLDEHMTTDTEYVHVCTDCNSLLCENCTVYCDSCADSGFGSIGAELCVNCVKTCAVCQNNFHNTGCLDSHQCSRYTCPGCEEDRDSDDIEEAPCISCGVCGVCSSTSGGLGNSQYCVQCDS
jgi:hypothetical protein